MKIFNSNTKMQKRQNSSPSELHLIPFSNDAAVAKIAYIGSERYNSYYIIDTTFLSVVFLSEKHRLWVNDKHQRTAVIRATPQDARRDNGRMASGKGRSRKLKTWTAGMLFTIMCVRTHKLLSCASSAIFRTCYSNEWMNEWIYLLDNKKSVKQERRLAYVQPTMIVVYLWDVNFNGRAR